MATNHPGPDEAARGIDDPAAADAVEQWFVDEVLPLETALTRLLRSCWRRADDIPDLRQEIYVNVFESAARDGIPQFTQAWLFRCARNLLINKARRARVVPFELIADVDELADPPSEHRTPERLAAASHEVELLDAAFEALPPRCRQVMTLRMVDGLSQKEIATRLGIVEGTVERQVTLGIRALAEDLSVRGVESAVSWMRRWRRPRAGT